MLSGHQLNGLDWIKTPTTANKFETVMTFFGLGIADKKAILVGEADSTKVWGRHLES